MLRVDNISYRIGDKPIIGGITTSFASGLFHVIVGPNGSGKSTFLRLFSGELIPETGAAYYDELSVSHANRMMLARRRAVMSQLPELHFPLSVDDIVMMGRYPHFNFQPSKKDMAICREAMERVDIIALSGRDYLTLSGGEKQRVQFARALAQIWEPPATSLSVSVPQPLPPQKIPQPSPPVPQPLATMPQQAHIVPQPPPSVPPEPDPQPVASRFLFLDEPVSSLDIHYQHQFLQIARRLIKENIVLIVVLHDINLAMQYADRILFMKEGRIVAEGPCPGIVNTSLINEVFNIPVHFLENPYGKSPVMVYDV